MANLRWVHAAPALGVHATIGADRTLKEQRLWIHRLETLDQARAIIGAFIETLPPAMAD